MLAHVLGHSFHIGGAVELLLAGVPPELSQPLEVGPPWLSYFTGIEWRKYSL